MIIVTIYFRNYDTDERQAVDRMYSTEEWTELGHDNEDRSTTASEHAAEEVGGDWAVSDVEVDC